MNNDQYGFLVTDKGLDAIRDATLSGKGLTIDKFVVGDGDGSRYYPQGGETALRREVYQGKINYSSDVNGDPSCKKIFMSIPEDAGDFWIREIGLYDSDNNLIFIGAHPETEKITGGQSSSVLDINMEINVSRSEAITIQCDNQAGVTASAAELIASREIKNHEDKENPHNQYALKNDVESSLEQKADKRGLSKTIQETKNELTNLVAQGQFFPYDELRAYKVGEVCYTKDPQTDEISYWQWYSNVESLAGKSPLLETNRHVGWSDNTKPFYWVPYTGDQVGMPFFWLDTSAPEWAVMEINVDLPIAVYWRLARRYPDLVNGDTINTGEIRGEFLRVLDQGRGVDSNREIASYQAGTKIAGEAGDANSMNTHTIHDISRVYGDPVYETTFDMRIQYNANTNHQRLSPAHAGWWRTTRPRNVSRPMAIAI